MQIVRYHSESRDCCRPLNRLVIVVKQLFSKHNSNSRIYKIQKYFLLLNKTFLILLQTHNYACRRYAHLNNWLHVVILHSGGDDARADCARRARV